MKPTDDSKPFESRLLEDLDPILADVYTKAEAEWNRRHNDVHVIRTCTYRNAAMQNVYFNKRPKISNAKGGQSPHNYYPALAFDVAFVNNKTRALDYAPKFFKEFADICASISGAVEWGGSWKSFKDAPHFQLKGWKAKI